MAALFQMALRYLRGHARRYVFVLIVLALGSAFITVASSLADGMEEAVTSAALRHYAGHVFVIGRNKQEGNTMVIDHPREVRAALERAGVPAERIIRRTHEHLGASVVFAGDAVRLKDVFGVDFRAEADLFESFAYADGSFDPSWGADTIVISEPTARRLGARVGDRLTLRLETRNEQANTRSLIVRAITEDDSIWGYARAYAARDTLTAVMDLAPAEFSMLGILLPDMGEATQWARRIEEEIGAHLDTAGRIETKGALTRSIRERWEGTRYFVFALPVYISEVTDLLTAMQAGSYALLAMIILVVLAAVVVTYRVVLHDRRREIGTMLAVGFTRGRVVAVLVAEAAILLAAGIAAGGVLAVGINNAIAGLSFDWIPGFEIFMQGGALTARYRPATVATNAAVVLGVTLPVTAGMALRTVRREIPALIRGETT